MKNSTGKNSRSCFNLSFLQTSLLLAIAILPLQLIAQKKVTGNAINKSSVASLAHVFKNYSVLAVDAPGLAAHARMNPGKNLDIQMDLAGLPAMRLDLVENNILGNDYKLIVGTATGEQVFGKPLVKTYKGKLAGDNNSQVYLTVSDQSVFGVIKGNGKEYYIEPLKYFSKDAAPGVSVLYEARDVIPYSGISCGVTDAEQRAPQLENNMELRASGTCKMVEVAIASDFSMLDRYRSPVLLQERNIGIMNLMVSIFHEAQIGTQYLEFKIAGQYISNLEAADPFLPAYNGNDANILLANFRNWGNNSSNAVRFGFSWDMAQLWTAKDISVNSSSSVVGLANVGTICTPAKYQVLEDFNASSLAIASMVAHETGHTFGCDHDGSPGYIMNPSVGNPPYTTFSSQSLSTMNSYISSQGSCLSPCEQTVVAQFSSSARAVCLGTPVTFTDYSVGAVTSRSWQFGDGSPGTSTERDVTVNYHSTGLKQITLAVSNGVNSATITKNIVVSDAPANCRTEGLNSIDYGILTSFKLENISMSDDILRAAGQYIDKTCTDITGLERGATYIAKAGIGINHIYDEYTQPSKLQVFLDYNNDGDFLDANENVYYTSGCAEAEIQFPITIPQSPPVLNRFLRLRVMAIPCSLEPTDGCSIPPNAQVVDFSVYVSLLNTYYRDDDRDLFGNPSNNIQAFSQPPGYVSNYDDCNDFNPFINPLSEWIIDNDNDGYYNNTPVIGCTSPGAAYKLKRLQQPGDCDDNNRLLHPLTQWITDNDNDGYYPGTPLAQCTSPGAAYFIKTTQQAGDCDDNNALLTPLTIWIADSDNDGYYPGTPVTSCTSPGAAYKLKLAQQPGDCNDNDPAVNAGTTEVCANGKDDNCNGVPDENICAPCANATGLTTTNITATSARLNWVAVANPLIWEIRYKKTGQGTQWITLQQLTGNIRSSDIFSLSPNSSYNWQIRAKCGNAWTKYTDVAVFVTPSNPNKEELITVTKKDNAKEIEVITELTAGAIPNPSHNSFTITVKSNNSKDRIILQVVDITGRVIETRTINAEQSIQMGEQYKVGIYIVRILQGKQVKQLKLVKLPG